MVANPPSIQAMFNRLAPRYDQLNTVISLGMHRGWKRRACQALALHALPHGVCVLDVCTGTGDLAAMLATQLAPMQGRVIAIDFSPEMLSIAQKRHAHLSNITWLQGDAMALPLEADSMDGAIISFGLRNVPDRQQALNELYRVLRPNRYAANLDTNPQAKLPGYWWYFSTIMPRLGAFLAQDAQAYHYLCDSTRQFLSPDELEAMWRTAGFSTVQHQAMALGTVALQVAFKG